MPWRGVDTVDVRVRVEADEDGCQEGRKTGKDWRMKIRKCVSQCLPKGNRNQKSETTLRRVR